MYDHKDLSTYLPVFYRVDSSIDTLVLDIVRDSHVSILYITEIHLILHNVIQSLIYEFIWRLADWT